MSLHISQGTTVNASWTDQIAISHDGGSTWSTLKKEQVKTIGQTRIPNARNESNPGSHQDLERIHIHLTDEQDFNFDVKDVDNQGTWNVGGTAGLAAAHADLSNWLA